MTDYIINRAGPYTVGSTGQTDGMDTPAVGCGFHATHYAQELFAAHREMVST